MRMLALLTGLTVATVLAGMVPANRTASETSVALADQNGTCVDCAVRQPIKDSEIPQEPRDDGCSGCADRQRHSSLPSSQKGPKLLQRWSLRMASASAPHARPKSRMGWASRSRLRYLQSS